MIALLNDKSVEVRRSAMLALGRLGRPSPEVVSALEKFENDPDKLTSTYADLALALVGKPRKGAVTRLFAILDLDHETAAKAAAQLLGETGRIKPELVIPGLVEKLSSDKKSTVKYALAAFRFMREHGASALPELEAVYKKGDRQTRLAVLSAIATMDKSGEHALPILKEAVRDKDSSIRREALMGFLRYKSRHKEFTDELLLALKDDDINNKMLAMGIVRGLNPKPPEALPVLISLTEDPSARVRSLVMHVISAQKAPFSITKKAFERGLKDKEAQVRRATASALMRVGFTQEETVAPVLVKALDTETDPKVKRAIITALKVLQRQSNQNDGHASKVNGKKDGVPKSHN